LEIDQEVTTSVGYISALEALPDVETGNKYWKHLISNCTWEISLNIF